MTKMVLSTHVLCASPITNLQGSWARLALSAVWDDVIEEKGLSRTKEGRVGVPAWSDWPKKNKVCINACRLIPNAEPECLHESQCFSRSPMPKIGWPECEKQRETRWVAAIAPLPRFLPPRPNWISWDLILGGLKNINSRRARLFLASLALNA